MAKRRPPSNRAALSRRTTTDVLDLSAPDGPYMGGVSRLNIDGLLVLGQKAGTLEQ
jgi:hypothetical protein